MTQYNSGRKQLPPGLKRTFYRVSAQQRTWDALDKVIFEMNVASPFSPITRTTVIETLIKEFIKAHNEKAAE